MRTALLTLALGLFNSSACPAQDWAKAMFDHTAHDFGVVARGAKVEHRFPMENIYLEDMRIESISSTCQCTKVEFSKEPVKTYGATDIVAVVDTRKFTGRKEATLRVKLAEPFPAEVQLHVYAYIRKDVVFEPGEVRFGSVDQGTSVEKRIRVSYAGRGDWEIRDVLCAWPHVEARVSQVSRAAGHVAYDLWVTLRADAPVGYIRDQLVLVTNDRNPKATRVPILLEGVVTPAVTAGPSPLPLGVLETGQSVTRNVVVRGKKPFRVLSALGPDERFQFKLPGTAAPVHLIPVTFAAGNAPGKVAGTISIRTDLDGTPPLEIQVDGTVLPGGARRAADSSPDWQPAEM